MATHLSISIPYFWTFLENISAVPVLDREIAIKLSSWSIVHSLICILYHILLLGEVEV